MGQATVSPDPLDEAAATTTSIASADDLLAQLAGEEIDRLLAESEAERAAVEHEPMPAPKPLVAEPKPAFEAIESAPVPAQQTPPAPPAPAVPNVVPESLAAPELDAEATAAAERAALNGPAAAVARIAHIAAAPTVAKARSSEDVPPLPIYLKPLEWLNAPLASCPESLRETLGKVAIVTLVNAIAVLVYVLLFRR